MPSCSKSSQVSLTITHNGLLLYRDVAFRVNPFATHIRHEWVLDLRPDEKTILAGMKEKWRYNIRLAGRKGIVVRRGEGQADLDTFYRIYETTSERDQFFIHDKSHYEDIMRMFGEGDRAARCFSPNTRDRR